MKRSAVPVTAVAAAALAIVFLVAGSDRAPEPPAGKPADLPERRPPTDEERIRALLAARAKALGRGAVPPEAGATPARFRADRREASRARRIGVRSVRFEARRVRISGARARADLAVAYRLDGIRGRYTADRRVHLGKSGGRWRVRAVRGARRRAPWEVADFRRVVSRHFVVLTPPEVDPAAGGLLATLESGYERMRGIVVRGRLRRRYLVVVAADGRQARALTADIQGVEGLAALTDTEVREAPGRARQVQKLLGQRLVVVWPAFAAAGPENGATVVIHELTHAVLAPVTSGRTPAWLTEGVALHVSQDVRPAQAAAATVDLEDLEPPDAIARLDGDEQSAAYAFSSAAARYIAERFGQDRLLELYDAFNQAGIRDQGEAVRKVLGLSLRAFEGDLRGWIAAGGL